MSDAESHPGHPSHLSHLDDQGGARMVDVGGKPTSTRVAVASGVFVTTSPVIELIARDGLPKGDVLAVARIAGIQGAKRASELIPLCHPLPLDSVDVTFELDGDRIRVTATARTTGRTGVEMEALTAVSVAGLTLHDMVKAVDPAASMTDVRLEEKRGGTKGDWTRAGGRVPLPAVRAGTATVLVASTRSAAGTQEDRTGPVLATWLEGHGFAVETIVVADADIRDALTDALSAAPAVIITTGGTGTSPSDRTPDATTAVLDQELPGIAEAIRARGSAATPTAWLSRGVAGLSRGTVIVNLPGSPGGVRDGIAVLDGLLDHLVAQAAGGGAHDGGGTHE